MEFVLPVAASAAEVEQAAGATRAKLAEWREADKAGVAERMLAELLRHRAGIAEEASASRGWKDEENRNHIGGYGGFLSSLLGVRALRRYIAVLKGKCVHNAVVEKSGGAKAVQVYPQPSDSWTSGTMELWSEPGKELVPDATVEGEKHQLVGILLAGNFDFPTDLLHTLFVRESVAVVKLHPVNESVVRLIFSTVFREVIEKGFVSVVGSDASLGQALVSQPALDSLMMTGGYRTYNRIVWDNPDGPEGENAQKHFDKPFHAELGAVSLWAVVPDSPSINEWSASTVAAQARHFLGNKMMSSGAVCASPQIIVLSKQWRWSELFVTELFKAIEELPPVGPYYPGTKDRMAALKQAYEKDVDRIQVLNEGSPNEFVIVKDVTSPDDYILHTEVFGPAFGIYYVDGQVDDESASFYANVAQIPHMGTLSSAVVIGPKTERANQNAFDEFVSQFRVGALGINVLPVYAVCEPLATWGALPGAHNPRDIQSGMGFQGNILGYSNVQKTVVRSPFMDQSMMMPPKPGHAVFGEKLCDFLCEPGFLSLGRMIVAKVANI